MAGAHEGKDDRAFFHAAIERTFELAVTDAGNQTSDPDGPMVPARYLVQAINFDADTTICWVHVGRFVEGSPLSLTAGPGNDRIPLNQGGAVAVEFNAVRDHSDRIGAITSAGGTCTVFITRVERTSKQANP